jgi:hypothetical protein
MRPFYIVAPGNLQTGTTSRPVQMLVSGKHLGCIHSFLGCLAALPNSDIRARTRLSQLRRLRLPNMGREVVSVALASYRGYGQWLLLEMQIKRAGHRNLSDGIDLY